MKTNGSTVARRRLLFSPSLGVIIAFFAALCFTSSGEGLSAAEQRRAVTIGGTGCALGGIQRVAEAFQKENPDVVIAIVPSLGSGGGIKAVLSGAVDLALSARPLNKVEEAQGAHGLAYARTPFVFATSGRARLVSLTLRQIVSMYAGEMRTWPDGKPLRLVLRPATDTDIEIIKRMSPDMERAVEQALKRRGLLSAVTDQDNDDLLSKLSGAFGATTLAQIQSEKRPLRPIILDGVVPNLASLASGAYPFSKTFYAVTGPRSSADTNRFLNYLFSPGGKAILKRFGHLTMEAP